MADATQVATSVFTTTSAFCLAAVAGIGVVAVTASRKLLPNDATWQDRWTFIWLVRNYVLCVNATFTFTPFFMLDGPLPHR